MSDAEVTPSGEDDNVPAGSEPDADLADRLRRALIGHHRATVVAAAGLSDRTFAKILNGHRPRAGTLASIADALGIRREWLASGAGSMLPADAVEQARSAAQRPDMVMEVRLGGLIDLARLGAAVRIAQRRHPHPDKAEEWVAMAKEIAELYDILTDQAIETQLAERAENGL